MRALCKYRGCLVIAEVTRNPCGEGKCPQCGNSRFREYNGWTECDNECGFAYLTESLKKAVVNDEQ